MLHLFLCDWDVFWGGASYTFLASWNLERRKRYMSCIVGFVFLDLHVFVFMFFGYHHGRKVNLSLLVHVTLPSIRVVYFPTFSAVCLPFHRAW